MSAAWATPIEDFNDLDLAYRAGTDAMAPATSSSSFEVAFLRLIHDEKRERDDRWSVARESLSQILDLDDDWDGAGARRIDRRVARTCARFLDALEAAGDHPPDRTVASPDGSVFFAWITQDGLVEAEVEEADVVEFTYPNGHGSRRRLELPAA